MMLTWVAPWVQIHICIRLSSQNSAAARSAVKQMGSLEHADERSAEGKATGSATLMACRLSAGSGLCPEAGQVQASDTCQAESQT